MSSLESTSEPSRTSRRDSRRFLPAKRFQRSQLLHFILVTAVPLFGGCTWLIYSPEIRLADASLLLGMWCLTGGLGISLGYHRYFTHNSFTASPPLQHAMGICGSMAGQGPITYWVAVHRCHHQHSDQPGDPHSPVPQGHASWWTQLTSFLHGHMGWVIRHDVPSPVFFARDVLKTPLVTFYDRTYWWWLSLGIALPGALAWMVEPSLTVFTRGCVYGGLLRLVFGNQIIWAINSLGHTAGARHFETRDRSCNSLLLAIPSFGEGWHNNHHAFPWSAKFGLKWWQIDLGWSALQCFALAGLASNLKQPRGDQASPTTIL